MFVKGARLVDLPSGSLCFDRSIRQARRDWKLVFDGLRSDDGRGVCGTPWAVVPVEGQCWAVALFTSPVVDVFSRDGHTYDIGRGVV